MSKWIHLSLNFKDRQNLMLRMSAEAAKARPLGKYKALICYLKDIIESLSGLINRYFYFFEPNPHLFLALEVQELKQIHLIADKIKHIKKPHFIAQAEIDLNATDDTNGEAAADFFYAAAKFAFFKVTKDYKPGYFNNDEVKLVHCFCNQLFVERRNEVKFYLKCLRFKGVKAKIICSSKK